jgi:hypothetical protein
MPFGLVFRATPYMAIALQPFSFLTVLLEEYEMLCEWAF